MAILPSASVLPTLSPHPGPAGDDLVGHVAVGAHAVPDHGHGRHHLHSLGGQLAHGGHHSSSCCCSTLVSGHSCHDSSSLDVSTASVVGDTLPHHVEGLLHLPLGHVGQPDDSTVMSRYTGCCSVDCS